MRVFAPWWRTLTALRLATKELRRNPRQGALVVTMVSLAGAVLMAVGTVHVSQQPTAQEQIRAELGQNQAWVDGSRFVGTQVQQNPTDPGMVGVAEDWSLSEGAAEAVEVPSLLPAGTEAIPIAQGGGTVRAGDVLAGAPYLAGELWRPEFAGLYDVVVGVAPAASDEVLVSTRMAELLDVAVGDSVELTSPNMTATVTGIVEQYRGSYRDFVVLPDAAMVGDSDQPAVTWYLPDLSPTWQQIQEWNKVGVVSYSRAVALDPPAVTNGPTAGSDDVAPAMLATAGIGLIALALLAGSAFSVGFRRDQRRLALLAANGASRGSLTAVGVASGFLLGVIGGVVGAAVGFGAGWAWITYLLNAGGNGGQSAVWGYHWEPLHALAAIAFCALAGALSALIPAAVASRLDVMSALRGARKPSPPRHWMAWVGSALVAVGAVFDIVATRRYDASLDVVDDSSLANQASLFMVAGFATAFAGLALVSPALLRALARVLAPVSVSARLAARDAARSVGRTVPGIGAIGATLAIATAVVVTNDQEISRWVGERSYTAPLGDGRIYQSTDTVPTTAGELVEAVRSVVPDATITEVAAWDTSTAEPGALVPEVAYPRELLCLHQGRTAREIAQDPRCDDGVAWNSSLAVGGAAQLSAITGQKPSQAALDALAGGGAVAFNPDQVTDGALTIQLWDYGAGNYPSYGDETAPTSTPSGEFELPSVVERPEGGQTRAYAGIISPTTAAELGYPVVPSTVYVHVDGGIDQKQESRINAALTTAGGGWLIVERLDETPQYQLLLAYAALAVALLVAGAATGVALGLARADARRDDFTLASLGASPRLARASAGWQGAIIVVMASAIGLATGLMTTWTLSYQSLDTQFSPPWLWLGAALIALPAVVGLLSAAFTRPVRAIHYRLAA